MDSDPTTATTEPSPFEALLRLQDEDLLADQLRHRVGHLPEHVELHDTEAAFSALERRAAPIRKEREEAAARQRALEDEIEDVSQRIAAIERRLLSDTSGSFRDQATMSTEVNSLTDRRRQLEDSALEVMEIIEPLDGQLAAIEDEESVLKDRARELLAELKVAEAAVTAELDEVLARREQLAASVPEKLRGEYERLRERLGGIGASRLTHGMCSGCNLSLSATELDHLRHASPEMLFHCDQCGRIIVP